MANCCSPWPAPIAPSPKGLRVSVCWRGERECDGRQAWCPRASCSGPASGGFTQSHRSHTLNLDCRHLAHLVAKCERAGRGTGDRHSRLKVRPPKLSAAHARHVEGTGMPSDILTRRVHWHGAPGPGSARCSFQSKVSNQLMAPLHLRYQDGTSTLQASLDTDIQLACFVVTNSCASGVADARHSAKGLTKSSGHAKPPLMLACSSDDLCVCSPHTPRCGHRGYGGLGKAGELRRKEKAGAGLTSRSGVCPAIVYHLQIEIALSQMSPPV